MIKKLLTLLAVLFSTYALFAQADISMSTSWYNRANYNPASIARTNYIYVFSNARKQWTGVLGAPETLNIQASGFNYNMHSGVGLSLVSDQIGFIKSLNPMLSYAYRINNNERWSLSFGIAGGVFSRDLDASSFDPENPVDPVLLQDFQRIFKPDANIGIEFQSSHFIAGISTTHLFSIVEPNPYYLISNHRYGYLVFKSTDWESLNFYTGLQVVNRSNLTIFEANASVRFKQPTGLTTGSKELFELGFTYRTSKQISALFGVNVSSNFRVGYVYDQTFLPGYNQNGSHEIMLEYRIPIKSAQCPVCNTDDSWYR